VNVTDDGGQTPLFVASLNKRVKAVEVLLKRGANVEAPTLSRWTPLHAAVSGVGRREDAAIQVAKMLLDAGANPYRPDQSGESPLARCRKQPGLDRLARVLDISHINEDDAATTRPAAPASKGQ